MEKQKNMWYNEKNLSKIEVKTDEHIKKAH